MDLYKVSLVIPGPTGSSSSSCKIWVTDFSFSKVKVLILGFSGLRDFILLKSSEKQSNVLKHVETTSIIDCCRRERRL